MMSWNSIEMARSSHDLGGSLRYQLESRDGTTWVALSGRVNEATDFTPLQQLASPVVFDLGGVDRMNSLGVRAWMYFVRDREAAGMDLTFERCSPFIVGQISMITNFMGTRSRVKSVLVPYFCTTCRRERVEVLEVSPKAVIRSTIPCTTCGSPMELDELEETYSPLLSPDAK